MTTSISSEAQKKTWIDEHTKLIKQYLVVIKKGRKRRKLPTIEDIRNNKKSRNLQQKYLYVFCSMTDKLTDKVSCILNAL